MDWSSSKGPSWDWPELEQHQSFLASNNNNNIDDGSRSFSVDLKLGSVITSQSQLGISDSPAVLPLPTKRARAANTKTTGGAAAAQQQVVYCLVDDCRSDLSNCRDYHRRHKVCEVHSKTPEVTIQGRKQRFCQQCSRFHAPEEFDEGKRSCRKRLDGHNRRRRKPPPDTHLQQGTYLSNYPGTGMLSFSNPSSHNHTMSRAISPTGCWSAGSVNRIEHNSSPFNKQQPQLNLLDKQIPFPSDNYSSTRYREAKRLTFLQAEYHHTSSHPQSSSERHMLYDNGGIQAPPPPPPDSSDCALSLLSRPMLPMHATEINFRNTIPVQSHVAILPRQLPTSHFSTMQPTVPAGSSDHVNFHSMFQTGEPDHHRSSGNHDEPQTLPFYWE